MVIAEDIDVRVGVFDIETIVGMFDIGIYDVDNDEWIEFEISAYKNDLYSFVKYYTEGNHFDYWVSFNGIGFDHQVLEYIVENHQEWHDLTGLQIAALVAEFGSKVIEDQRYELPPKYKDYQFSVMPLDVFRIHHFDNKARRTSLKWCEFMMNMDVEEMPIHHTQAHLSPNERIEVINYRRHDVMATLALLYLTLGNLEKVCEIAGVNKLDELKDYRGKNKIQDRFDVAEETGMKCLNWSDVKIGEEWNKLDYIKEERVKDQMTLFTKDIKHPYGQRFKNFFPKTMSFRTQQLKDFVEKLGEEFVKSIEQKFPITIGQTTYTVAKGGIHSIEKHRTIKVPKGWSYTDIDVGSQYPNSIAKLRIFAPHLKSTIIEQFIEKIKRRFVYKDKAKELIREGKYAEARPFSSVQEMLKLCLNGGYYGKLNQPGSFLEYPEGYLKVCMGNQIEILMLIEMMEMSGFRVMSGNTDGITVMYPDSERDKFLKICKEWEVAVGNVEMGKLEHTEFAEVYQEAVNSYIAKKMILKDDGTKVPAGFKKKGKFLTDFELNKNKSSRVITLALEAYFTKGTNPIDFITNHQNIFDFCVGKKSSYTMHYEEIVDEETINIHKKLVRYYMSTDGNVMKKRGHDYEGKPVDSFCEAADSEFFWMPTPKQKYFNRAWKEKDMSGYNIDYSYYILKTLKRIDKITKSKMAKQYADTFKTQQTSLF